MNQWVRVDPDGKHCALYADISSPANAGIAAGAGAEGIGLFRMEFFSTDQSASHRDRTI